MFVVQTALCLVTGSMVVMWLSEVITERGIGQGASLVIFLNIVGTLPRTLGATIEAAQTGDRNTVLGIVVLVMVFLITIVGIIFVQRVHVASPSSVPNARSVEPVSVYCPPVRAICR